MGPACNLSGRISPGQTGLHGEFEASLGYMRSFPKQGKQECHLPEEYLPGTEEVYKAPCSLMLQWGSCLEVTDTLFDREGTAAGSSEPSNPGDLKT